jgi:hypothetical protein
MRRDEENVTGGDSDVGRPGGKTKQDARESRVMDREVPLPTAPGHAVLHDWLDGDVEQARARDVEGSSQVELWNRINEETRMLRSRTTPVHVQKAIMSALPDEAPASPTATIRRVSPKTIFLLVVVAAAAAAFAAGLFR